MSARSGPEPPSRSPRVPPTGSGFPGGRRCLTQVNPAHVLGEGAVASLRATLRVEVEDLRGASSPPRDPQPHAIGLDDDGAITVGPIDAGAGCLEPGERLGG